MIDPKIQTELRERFNPDGSLIRQVQMRMFEMLKHVDKLCRENGIKYWLSSGTCLGAIRHGGFIPWDDDVDIELEKEDFKRLIDLLLKDDRYFIHTHETDIEYTAPYAKLRDKHSYLKEQGKNDINYKNHGIYIDIFCIEPSSTFLLSRICSIFQHRLLYPLSRIGNKKIRHTIIKCNFFIFHKMLFPFVSYVSKFNSRGWYRHIPGSSFCRRRFYDDIKDVKYVPFEDIMLPVPINAEGYLGKLYGDFNNLPPLDKLAPHINKVEIYDSTGV